jgi:hypothetical protein
MPVERHRNIRQKTQPTLAARATEDRVFQIVARALSGGLMRYTIRNVGSLSEALEELHFQVRDIRNALVVVK